MDFFAIAYPSLDLGCEMFGIGKTDVGLVRQNNEDYFFITNEPAGAFPNLFILADGMGGHAAGEVASQSAVEACLRYIENSENEGDDHKLLKNAVSSANAAVYSKSEENAEQRGMGTTLTVCSVSGNRLHYAHVGDSRLYLMNNNWIDQITDDHTVAAEMHRSGAYTKEQAENHPHKHMLTRALGTDTEVAVDSGTIELALGSCVLICSDGLTNMVTDEEILTILMEDNTREIKLDLLIELAKERGGVDNITVILISQR